MGYGVVREKMTWKDCASCGNPWDEFHMRLLEDGHYCPLCYAEYLVGRLRRKLGERNESN